MSESVVAPDTPRHRGPRKGRTISLVGLLTVLVALTGYVREASLAARFGVSATMDAYFAAIFVPMLLYLVLIAGTLSTVLIPILLQDDGLADSARASETFSVITNFVLLVLLLTVAAGIATAWKWLPIVFPGFGAATTGLAVRLTYIMLPAVVFLGVAGILTALLNGFHRFAVAAFAPALASVAVIGGILLARGPNAIYLIGFATAIGFLLQCLVMVPAAASLGIRYRPLLNLRHPAIGKLMRVGIPLLAYFVVANASLFLERNLASRLSAGAVSTVTYALRLFTVPANFFAAPLATVFYPEFARKAAQKQYWELREQTARVLRLVVFLFLPITVWTVLNALPLTRVLYERGQFHPEDSLLTSRVLALYSIGILPNAVAIVLLRCFYAVQDTVTPLYAELIDLGYYVVAATLLTRHFGLSGLALARGGTFFVVATILVVASRRKFSLLAFDHALLDFLSRTAAAAFAMALVSWGGFHFLKAAFDAGGTPFRLGIMLSLAVASAAVFFAASLILKIGEAKQIFGTAMGLLGLPGGGDT